MADNYQVVDANQNKLNIKSKDLGNSTQIPQSVPSDQTGNPFIDTNPLSVVTQPRSNIWTDKSSGLLVANPVLKTTSQQILAANPLRKGVIIQNLDSQGFIYINFGSAAVNGPGSFILTPYERWEIPAHVLTSAAIFAMGDSNGQFYTCKEIT